MATKNKILIVGAGVIGGVFAVKLSLVPSNSVFVLARGERLKKLKEVGLLYENDVNQVKQAAVQIIDKENLNGSFDYIIVSVRRSQVREALTEIKDCHRKAVIVMANDFIGYNGYEEVLGRGDLVPSFPGAGGNIVDGVLSFRFAPKIIQPTYLGEVHSEGGTEVHNVVQLFKTAKIPVKKSKYLEDWQKCHIALITAIDSGFYFDGGTNYTTAKNREAVKLIVSDLKTSLRKLQSKGVKIIPRWLDVIIHCPDFLLLRVLGKLLATKFIEKALFVHLQDGMDERIILKNEFNDWLNS